MGLLDARQVPTCRSIGLGATEVWGRSCVVWGTEARSSCTRTASMTNGTQPRKLSAILCADWGKELPKRAVYVADVAARVVRRVSAERVVRGRSPRGSRAMDIDRVGPRHLRRAARCSRKLPGGPGQTPRRSADGDFSRPPGSGAFDAALLRCHHGRTGLDRRAAVLFCTCRGWWPWNVCRCRCSPRCRHVSSD